MLQGEGSRFFVGLINTDRWRMEWIGHSLLERTVLRWLRAAHSMTTHYICGEDDGENYVGYYSYFLIEEFSPSPRTRFKPDKPLVGSARVTSHR